MFNRIPITTRKPETMSVGSRGTRPVWEYSTMIGALRRAAAI